MKIKIKKIISALKHAKERPDWRRKFIKEIKDNGFKSAIKKMKNKIYITHETTFIPQLFISNAEKAQLIFPNHSNPLVSIIIPVYNNFDYTYLCLKSILEHSKDTSYEIIVADDNSSDETINLDQYAKEITILRDGINRGFLLNCNNAASSVRGQYILFLNNDTQVQLGWLSALVELIESDETIGMVGSKLVYPDGRLQEAGGIIWNNASGWNYGHLDDPTKPEYNYVKEIDYISGASLMIKKMLWETIGGFDERYAPAYYEDSDLAFEVRKHGYKAMYQPKSVVVHFEGISNGTDLGSGIKQYQVINQNKFFNKWENILKSEHFPNAENVFLARDRTHTQKTMLYIDHYVPHFDQDAGSRAVLSYLKVFRKQGINIKFLGDNFYNYPDTEYVTTLEQMGIEVLYGEYYSKNWKEWFKLNAHYIDHVILSRPHIAEKYIDFIRTNSKAKIIYFGVDLHYLRFERESSYSLDKTILKESEFWKECEFLLMKKADLSCFYSYVEIEAIELEKKEVNVVNIPLYVYDFFPALQYNYKERKDIMFIGGFTHTPNVDGILWFSKEIMPIIREKIPGIRLYIIGSNAPENILNLANTYPDIIVTGKVSDEELDYYYASCRLSIAPLRFGAGIKGKIVEALYKGMPTVTTSIGAEGLVNAQEAMLIADDEQNFAKHIITLYNDELKSTKLAQQAHTYCKNNFSQTNILEIL